MKLNLFGYLLILIISMLISYLSIESDLWFGIPIGSVVSTYGFFRNEDNFISYGMYIIGGVFFGINILSPLTLSRVIIFSIVVMLIYSAITYLHRLNLILSMNKERPDRSEDVYLNEFRNQNEKYILMTIFAGSVLTIVTSVISYNNFIGLPAEGHIYLLSIVLTVLFLVLIYILLLYLPARVTDEEQ